MWKLRSVGCALGVCSWWVCEAVSRRVPDHGTRDVSEGDVVGHLAGHPSGKGTDLFVDVHKERVRFPTAHLANGDCVDFVEVHCHGAASSEGVAADI